MKILSTIETLGHGGAETVAIQLAAGLAENHDCRFAHLSTVNGCKPHAPFPDRLQYAGVTTYDAHWLDLQQPPRRAQLFRNWQPDIVIFHWWKGHPLTPWMQLPSTANGERPIFVAVLHHQGNPCGPLYDRYVAVTPSQLPALSETQRARCRVIPNGIDLTPFSEVQPRHNGRFTIGRLSSLRPGKLPDDWISTAVGFGIPDAHWVIAGDGPLRGKMRAEAERLGSSAGFEFPGYIEEQHRKELFARFTVGCYVPGHIGEAHPLALMETAAAGVPLVALRSGGIADIVEHGVNGMLADSISEVGAHLHRLRADPVLREALAEGGRVTAAERFSAQRQLLEYLELLKELEQ